MGCGCSAEARFKASLKREQKHEAAGRSAIQQGEEAARATLLGPAPEAARAAEVRQRERQIVELADAAPERVALPAAGQPAVDDAAARALSHGALAGAAGRVADDEEAGSAEGDGFECGVCFGPARFALSPHDCGHSFCGDCVKGCLDQILTEGQFPAVCPSCRMEEPDAALGMHSDENHDAAISPYGVASPAKGRITAPALTFFEHRGVVTRDFQFRFMKQDILYTERDRDARLHKTKKSSGLQPPFSRKGSDGAATVGFFSCPDGCGDWLLPAEPGQELFQHDGRRYREAKVGVAPCGALVCLVCRCQFHDDEAHECPGDKLPEAKTDKELLAENGQMLAQLGAKACPFCGIMQLKEGGCNFMACRNCGPKECKGFACFDHSHEGHWCWVTGKKRSECGGSHGCH